MIFLTEEPPKLPILIEPIVIEEKKDERVKPKLTLKQKIKRNHYKCDTDVEWIRADNARCLPKQPNTQLKTKNQFKPIKNASNNAPRGWFPDGQCTHHVWTKRSVGKWNNASDWMWQARRDGWKTGYKAKAGAIAWRYGHVAYTVAVKGKMMLVSEANYDNAGSVREIWVPVSDYTGFIY